MIAVGSKGTPVFWVRAAVPESRVMLPGKYNYSLHPYRPGPAGTSSGNCQETETHMFRTCHAPRQSVRHHFSGQFGGWVTLWSAGELKSYSGRPCP